jgi:hypothetical protein
MTEIRRPSEVDLARITDDKTALIDRLLEVIELEIVPLTRVGVREGNKIFGGAVLRKSDLSTVVVVTNRESVNPLNHGVASRDRWKSEDGIGSEADLGSSQRRTTPWIEG